jgi:hypothetical protein
MFQPSDPGYATPFRVRLGAGNTVRKDRDRRQQQHGIHQRRRAGPSARRPASRKTDLDDEKHDEDVGESSCHRSLRRFHGRSLQSR